MEFHLTREGFSWRFLTLFTHQQSPVTCRQLTVAAENGGTERVAKSKLVISLCVSGKYSLQSEVASFRDLRHDNCHHKQQHRLSIPWTQRLKGQVEACCWQSFSSVNLSILVVLIALYSFGVSATHSNCQFVS